MGRIAAGFLNAHEIPGVCPCKDEEVKQVLLTYKLVGGKQTGSARARGPCARIAAGLASASTVAGESKEAL